MRLFRRLRKKLNYLADNREQIQKIYNAYCVAKSAHQGQKRVSGEAYISHPVEVACILADMHMDHQSVMAGLLHDVIEDTPISKSALENQFGQAVAELVDGVTKLKHIKFRSKEEAQAEYFRKMILAMVSDVRVVIIKLADRLHNLRTIGPLPPKRRKAIAKETLDIFAPLAHRLGMHDFALQINDLAFEVLYPRRFKIIDEAVRKAHGNRKEVLVEIQKALKGGLSNSYLLHYEVKGREKSLYSIYRKMRDKKLLFNEIMDVYAFRILVETVGDCYRCLGIVHSVYKPRFERFKDYIASPKSNGYQSLHTTLFGPYAVPVEIQIRTYAMEQMAQSGVAAYWLYRTGDHVNQSQLLAQQWVKNLLDMQQRTGNSLEFIENVKIDLVPDEVYVFSPKGDILALPMGATVIDFAFAVHTDIGNSCITAKVNRRLAPLSTVLTSGQTVEIIVAREGRPSETWLNFVTTGKARSNIRQMLKKQKFEEALKLGKQLLKKALKGVSLSFRKLSPDEIDIVLKEVDLTHFDALLRDIGLGKRPAILVARRFARLKQLPESVEKEPESLSIKGTEGAVVHFGGCCCPIPGDPILGLLLPGYGIEIHRDICHKIKRWSHNSERVTPVYWHEKYQGEFISVLKASVINKKGMLMAISIAVSEQKASIEDVELDVPEEDFCFAQIKVAIQDRRHLARVISSIKKMKEVIKIERVAQVDDWSS